MNENGTWRIWPPLFLAFVLQTSVLARLEIAGAHLDLPLLVVLCVALVLGWREGLLFGLVAGMTTAYLVAKNPGALAFSVLMTGAVVGLTTRASWRENPFAPPLLAALGTLFCDAIVLVMTPTDFSISWWLHHTPVRMLTNAVFIWPVLRVLSRWLNPPSKLRFG